MDENPYRSPKSASSTRTPRRGWWDYAPEYHGAMWTGLKLQAALGVLSALVLDMGQTFLAFWVALLCQLLVVWFILFRRPMNPTRLDLAIVRYGIIPLLAIIAGFGQDLLRLMGIGP